MTRTHLGLTTVSLLLAFACGDAVPIAETSSSDSTDSTDSGRTETGDASGSEDASTGETTDGDGTETGDPACDPNMPELVEREYLAAGQARTDQTLPACDDHVWWVSAAGGSELTIAISASAPVEVAINYPDTPSFDAALTSTTLYSPGSLEFDSPRSGEFAVLVHAQNPADDPSLELDYDITVNCTNNCGLETTRFPVVMVHGWTGFENIGPLTYFYGVREDLEQLGYSIAIAVLDPYNSVDVRGEQLVDFVANTLTTTRSRKVNLFGHSQGGIDSRYVASAAGGGYGDRVGAVITLGTPHRGTPFTDIALGLIPGATEQVLVFLLNFLGAAQSQQSDVEASLYTLSETHMQNEFNVIHVDDPRVKYYSWTGETCVGGIGCLDAVDALLLFSYDTIYLVAGENDGLVPTSSAIWGEYLGLVPADHIDEIGQIGGLTDPDYDHVEFFRQNARMLRDEAF
jgi:triacylglycerol esterase/lipase EstA (alpha/beta hydrolase family)